MKFIETSVSDAYVVEIEKIEDERGFFARAFCAREFEEQGLVSNFVQTNMQVSKKAGTLRGMHLQIAPKEEAKLVRCTRGAIFDVVIDIRPSSPTYMKWYGIELNASNQRMLYIPKGCAHGYQALEDDTEVFYPVSEFYSPDYERGIRWNDPQFKIQWPLVNDLIITEKDQSWPDFKSF